MFERETKREKILEARHRELRLKERARSESQEMEVEESPCEVLDRARREFFEVIEAELQRRVQAETQHVHGKVPGTGRTDSRSRDSLPWGRGRGSASAFQVKDHTGEAAAAAQGEESQLPKDKEEEEEEEKDAAKEEEEEKDAAKVSALQLCVAFPLLARVAALWLMQG